MDKGKMPGLSGDVNFSGVTQYSGFGFENYLPVDKDRRHVLEIGGTFHARIQGAGGEVVSSVSGSAEGGNVDGPHYVKGFRGRCSRSREASNIAKSTDSGARYGTEARQ